MGEMGDVIGPPGKVMEEHDSPYHRCATTSQANRAQRARGEVRMNRPRGEVDILDLSIRIPLGRLLHAELAV